MINGQIIGLGIGRRYAPLLPRGSTIGGRFGKPDMATAIHRHKQGARKIRRLSKILHQGKALPIILGNTTSLWSTHRNHIAPWIGYPYITPTVKGHPPRGR